MLLQNSSWPEVEAYLEKSRGIILPIGSTEQHGPTGLIGTDAICAEVIARGVGEATGALVTPTIAFGMAQHHLAFPGSVTLRPTTLIRMLSDIVLSLARHGFTDFYFVNGHGGNIATVAAAFSEIYARRSLSLSREDRAPRCRLRNWWQGRELRALVQELYGEAEGSHATPSEVAIAAFAYPEAIKVAPLDPPIAPKTGGFTDAEDYRRSFPDGRIGSNPSLANPEDGRRLYEVAVEAVAQDYLGWVAK
jgi:creatinine amidohydrolase